MTHPTWSLPVEDNSASLILTPCPGTKGLSLQESIEQLKAQGVTVVVTALSNEEMHEKGVAKLPQVVKQAGLQWFQTVIEDDCAPDETFSARWEQVSPYLHNALAKGDNIAMHCMGGSGRTGLLAAHLLLEKGWELNDIIHSVQSLRPNAFTKDVQVEYIQQMVNQ